jgi:IMP dehydrogenase
MTPRERLVTVPEGVTPARRKRPARTSTSLERLLVVERQLFELKGLITVKDIAKAS